MNKNNVILVLIGLTISYAGQVFSIAPPSFQFHQFNHAFYGVDIALNGHFYIVKGDDEILELDENLITVNTWEIPKAQRLTSIVHLNGFLWVGDIREDLVFKIDLRDFSQETFSVSEFPDGIGTDGTNIFIVKDDKEKILGILNPSSGNQIGTLSTSVPDPVGITFDGTNLLILDESGDTYEVNPTTGHSAYLFSAPERTNVNSAAGPESISYLNGFLVIGYGTENKIAFGSLADAPPQLSLSPSDLSSPNTSHRSCGEPLVIRPTHTNGKWNVVFNGNVTESAIDLQESYTVSDCDAQWKIHLEDPNDSSLKSNSIEITWGNVMSPQLSLSPVDKLESANKLHLQCNESADILTDHTNGKWNVSFNGEETEEAIILQSKYTVKDCGNQWTIYLVHPDDSSLRSNTIEIVWDPLNEGYAEFSIPNNNIPVKVLDVPVGKSDIFIGIKSIDDVNLLLIDNNGTRIIHPDGKIYDIDPVSIEYNDVTIQYSGSKGDGYNHGHEYIQIIGRTQNAFTVYATSEKSTKGIVNYSFDKFIIFMGISGGDLLEGDLWDGGDGIVNLGIKSRMVEAQIDCASCNPNNLSDLTKIASKNITGGLTAIAYNVNNTVFSRVAYFSPGNTDILLNNIQDNYLKRPNAKIYLAGHSAGGGDVQNLLWKLKELEIPVIFGGLIDSIEPIDFIGLGDENIPNNTQRAMGFYQKDGDLITRGEDQLFAEDQSKTTVTNTQILKPKGPSNPNSSGHAYHKNMDNDSRIWKPILEYIKKTR